MKNSFRISFLVFILSTLTGSVSFAGSGSLAKRTLPTSSSGQVLIKITTQSKLKAYAVEETLPNGCKASEIDNNGRADKNGNIIKWGIFFDQKKRELSYQLTCPEGGTEKLIFKGVASFDGDSIEISGDNTLRISAKSPSIK